MSHLYVCDGCGKEKKLETKWRGIDCSNCEGMMKFKGMVQKKKYLNRERLVKGGERK